MSESEINLIYVEVKRLLDKTRDQQDLLDKRDCSYKEEVTRLQTQLEEGNKKGKQYKGKEDKCQRLQDEVTSLRNLVNESNTTTKELKERTSYCEGLEVEVVSLKVDIEKSSKKKEELLQAF